MRRDGVGALSHASAVPCCSPPAPLPILVVATIKDVARVTRCAAGGAGSVDDTRNVAGATPPWSTVARRGGSFGGAAKSDG
jgi:hypothetical protein